MYLIQKILDQKGDIHTKRIKDINIEKRREPSKENKKENEADILMAQLISLSLSPSITEEQIVYFHNKFDQLEQKGYLLYCGLIDQCLQTQETKAHIPLFKRPLQTKIGWKNAIIPNMSGTKISNLKQEKEILKSFIPENYLNRSYSNKKYQRRIIVF